MYIILLLCFTVRFVALRLCKTRFIHVFCILKNLIVPIGKLLNAYKTRCDFFFLVFLCKILNLFNWVARKQSCIQHQSEGELRCKVLAGQQGLDGKPLSRAEPALLSAAFTLFAQGAHSVATGSLALPTGSGSARLFVMAPHLPLQQPFLAVTTAEVRNDLFMSPFQRFGPHVVVRAPGRQDPASFVLLMNEPFDLPSGLGFFKILSTVLKLDWNVPRNLHPCSSALLAFFELYPWWRCPAFDPSTAVQLASVVSLGHQWSLQHFSHIKDKNDVAFTTQLSSCLLGEELLHPAPKWEAEPRAPQ